VALEAYQVRALRQERAIRQLFTSSPPGRAFEDKWALHDYASEHIGRDLPITYLEFGVASGDSLRRACARFSHPESRMIGFDSFHGLPEDWLVGARMERNIPKGTFAREGQPPRVEDARVSFVVGWFQNTVATFVQEDLVIRRRCRTLIHFDADLYSSTLFLLATLWAQIPEYWFIMDDFTHDDAIALHDFKAAFPIELEWIAHRGKSAQPTQVLGRMKRIPFVLGA
jgi:O-methyltransferase